MEHYLPETMISLTSDNRNLREEMIRMHRIKIGIESEKAEEDFILLSQSLPHYGGHFYTATWVRDVFSLLIIIKISFKKPLS